MFIGGVYEILVILQRITANDITLTYGSIECISRHFVTWTNTILQVFPSRPISVIICQVLITFQLIWHQMRMVAEGEEIIVKVSNRESSIRVRHSTKNARISFIRSLSTFSSHHKIASSLILTDNAANRKAYVVVMFLSFFPLLSFFYKALYIISFISLYLLWS